jgi:hypothetical protein
MFGNYRSNKDSEVQRLEDQISRMRDDQDRERQRERDKREERIRQRRQEHEEAQLHADTFEDGFNKGLPRARHEAIGERQLNEKMKADPEFAEYAADNFFEKWVAQLGRGQQIYNEETQVANVEIERLQAEVERVRESIRAKAAIRIEAEGGDQGLVEALRENNPDYLTNW